MKENYVILFFAVFLLGLLYIMGPDEPPYKPIDTLSGVPKEIQDILQKSCFDCHSSQTTLRWYDKIFPFKNVVYGHIIKGKQAMDFSKWEELDTNQQNAKLFYSVNKILAKEMPLSSYQWIHPEIKVTEQEIKLLKEYLLRRTTPVPTKTNQKKTVQEEELNREEENQKVGEIQSTVNRIAYPTDYRNWTVISMSDRFDNGTIRIIYGNEKAVEAIRNQKINPWPEGTILAKAAWKQQVNEDGSIAMGEFVQVEFMFKDTHKYKYTAGWGWARWKGPQLKPYGETKAFVVECMNCHKPQKERDYVFTKPFDLK